MDQSFLSKKYPKTFPISSKLIPTKPPVFISDMLNCSCLQFLELHRSQKWEGGAERGVTTRSPGNELQLPPWPRGETLRDPAPSLPSQPSLGPAPSPYPHCLCPLQLFSPTYSPLFSLSWFDPSWASVFPTARVSQSLSLKAFPACPASDHTLPAARKEHGFLHTGVCYSWGKRIGHSAWNTLKFVLISKD